MPLLPRYNMFEEFGFRGEWWDPARPERKLPGVMRWTPRDGARVELHEHVASTSSFKGDGVLHGVCGNTDQLRLPVTLQGAWVFNDSSLFTHQLIRASVCIVGAHLQPTDGTTFHAIDLHLDSLAEWFGFEPWDIDELDRQFKQVDAKSLPLASSPNVDMKLDNETIRLQASDVASFGRNRIHIDHDVLLSLTKYESPQPFPAWRNIVDSVSRLITLLACEGAHPRSIAIHLTTANSQPRPLGDRVRIYYRHQRRRESRGKLGRQMPFQFPRVGKELLGTVANRWFELHDKLKDCMRLLFRQVERPGDEIVPRFLSACQMFEAFHRGTRDETYAPPDKYAEWLPKMVAGIPQDVESEHRQALTSKLRFGNQRSLRTRLRTTFAGLPEAIRAELEIDPRRDADLITKARNFHTHLDDGGDGGVPDEGQLFPLSSKLVMTVGYLLWCDLGLEHLIRPRDVLHLWMLS